MESWPWWTAQFEHLLPKNFWLHKVICIFWAIIGLLFFFLRFCVTVCNCSMYQYVSVWLSLLPQQITSYVSLCVWLAFIQFFFTCYTEAHWVPCRTCASSSAMYKDQPVEISTVKLGKRDTWGRWRLGGRRVAHNHTRLQWQREAAGNGMGSLTASPHWSHKFGKLHGNLISAAALCSPAEPRPVAGRHMCDGLPADPRQHVSETDRGKVS